MNCTDYQKETNARLIAICEKLAAALKDAHNRIDELEDKLQALADLLEISFNEVQGDLKIDPSWSEAVDESGEKH